MKKLIMIPLMVLVCSTGCEKTKALRDVMFQPVVDIENTSTNKLVNVSQITSSNGVLVTNIVQELRQIPVQIISTNEWVLNPSIAGGIRIMGDVAPVPWGGLAASGLISALGAFAAFRSRKWKKATVSAVQSADKWRQVVKGIDPVEDQKIKNQVMSDQAVNGTVEDISKIVKRFIKK